MVECGLVGEVLPCRHTEDRRLQHYSHERSGPGSERQVAVVERSVRKFFLELREPTVTAFLR